MVAESGELIGLWWCGACVEYVKLLWEEPALVAEGELELIAIALSLSRAQDGEVFTDLNLADALEGVADDLILAL